MKKAVINYQKTTGIAREEQIMKSDLSDAEIWLLHDQWYAEKKDFIKKMRLLFPILQKKEANEAEKSWEWLQPWITMKW